MPTETILCECGIWICGKSVEVAKSNLEQHKKSEKHKNQLAAVNLSKLDMHGVNCVTKNSNGDYEVSPCYSWKGIEKLKEAVAIINYEKNLVEEE